MTGETKDFYVRTRFEYDESTKTMRVGKYDFSVMEFTESRLRLQLELHNKWISWDNEVTYEDKLYTYEYKAAEPIRFDGDEVEKWIDEYEQNHK